MLKTTIIFLVIYFIYLYFITRPFKNPYKLVFIFGKKGSGKSTMATKLATKFNKNGWIVFSDSPIFNTYKLDPNWIGKYDFPPNSVLIIDEGAIVFHQRNWKQFKNEMKDFFVMQRHKRVYVVVMSQSFNIDKVIRDLTDEIYLMVNYLGVFSIAKRINKGVKLANENNDADSFIGEQYSWDLPWNWLGVYIPRWKKFFNSYRSDPLSLAPRKLWKFENPAYLYKLTNWKFYKIDELRDYRDMLYRFIDRHYRIEKFNVSDEYLDRLWN